MKPITKHLVKSAFILALVTVASLSIRQVRFSIHRANTIESLVIADTEPDPNPADSHTVDAKPEPQYTDTSDWDVDDEPDLQHANSSDSDKETPSDNYTDVKSIKGNFAKSKGSKGLEKISLSDYDSLYITEEGELWYVSKYPDGKTIKMQVQIDDTTGEITIVDVKSGGSKGLEKISLGDYDNLYITEEGEQWYVSEQPDGSISKTQVQIDDTTDEITVISNEDYAKSDNGEEGAAKD